MIKFYDSMGPSQGIAALSDVVDALDFWQDGATVKAGEVVRSSTNSMIYAVAQTAGVTGTVEPVWGSTADVTIADNTVTWLVKDIRTADAAKSAAKWTAPIKINGIDVDGSHDITLPTDTIDGGSYIGSGLKVSSFDGLNVNISSGRAKIAGNGISFPSGQLALNPRKASLMYLDSAGTLGKVDCANPLDFVDDNTVGMWIFNQTVAGANVPNSAVGKSAIAVANDMIPSGGIASVDGRFDFASKLDGVSGKYTSQNYLNIPIGAAAREVNILWTAATGTTIQEILWWGGTTGSTGFSICQLANNNLSITIPPNLTYDTGFTMSNGVDYIITAGYTGTALYIKVNGVPVYSVTVAIATTATVVCVGGQWSASFVYGKGTVHFVEIRNAPRSDSKTYEIANKMLLPCFYTDANSKRRSILDDVLPTNAVAVAFARTSSTVLLDYNDLWPAYGRREGASGGNRKFFLQYVPVSGKFSQQFKNPFGTENVKVTIFFKKNLADSMHSQVNGIYGSGAANGPYVKKVSPESIEIKNAYSNILLADQSYTGADETSGYIGLLVEMAEDFVGVV